MRIATLKLLGAVAALAAAQSASALSIDFTNPTIDDSHLSTDIVISGLSAAGQAVSGYDLFIDFTGALAPSAWALNIAPFGDGDPLDDPIFGADLPSAGVIELSLIALVGDSTLIANQGDTLDLGTLSFTPSGATGTLSFDFSGFGQVTGLTDPSCGPGATNPACPFPVLLQFSTGGTPVPEPTTLALFGLSLGALGYAATRRRRQARQA